MSNSFKVTIFAIFAIFIISCSYYIPRRCNQNSVRSAIFTSTISTTSRIDNTIASTRKLTPKTVNDNNTFHRTNSLPYVTGDTFRSIANFVIDDKTDENLSFDTKLVNNNDTIFIKTDYLDYFFNQIFINITKQIILITHNSDRSAPGKYATYLDSPYITAWFAQNQDVVHPKLIPIPIGFANSMWIHGDSKTIRNAEINYKLPWNQRKILLYINFHTPNNRQERERYFTLFESINGSMIVKKRINYETYLKNLGNSKFVLSPPGAGMDCHRHWESLFMGAIPIVKNSTLHQLFKDYPFLVLSDFDQLKFEMLENPHIYIKNINTSAKPYFMDMWLKKIYKLRFNYD